jgi:hypothetical protein
VNRLLDPVPAEPWRIARIGIAAALLYEWLPRFAHLREVYSSEGIVVGGVGGLPDVVVFSPTTVLAIWCALVSGAVLLLFGKLTRFAIPLLLATTWALNLTEGMNFKAYDRLGAWILVALLLAPAAASGRRETASPAPRWFLMLVFCGIYGSTGFSKLLAENDWMTGEPLAYDFVSRDFGGLPLGVWMSGQRWITVLLCWFTLAFECAFPLLVWFRRTNPWILAAGAFFHLGVLFTLDVPVFTPVALSAYPVMLHPDAWSRLRGWVSRLALRERTARAVVVGR